MSNQIVGVAIDLGSARTRAWVPGRGIVFDVPTVSPGARTMNPVQRGTVVDPDGAARMLDRLLSGHLPRYERGLVVLTTPVLSGPDTRDAALAALEELRARSVLTVPAPKAIALAAAGDLSRPLLIVDIGAQLTEVTLLTDGAVTDAYRAPLGTSDLDETTTFQDLTRSVVAMITDMLRLDRTSQTLDALHSGVLVAGGGALRPEFTYHLAGQLRVVVHPVPAPHTAALRGAAKVLESAHRHPAVIAHSEHPPGP